jgi:hypothetical protein
MKMNSFCFLHSIRCVQRVCGAAKTAIAYDTA